MGEADELGDELLHALDSPAARYSNLCFLIVDLSLLRVLGDVWRTTIEEGLARVIEDLLETGTLLTTERPIALSALLAITKRRAAEPDDALRQRVSTAAHFEQGRNSAS